MRKERKHKQRGQAVMELALQIPIMMLLLFGAVQVGRVFFTYHTLQKAVRGGAGLIARSVNVDYCAIADPALADARNFIVYGNLQGQGAPVVQGLIPDMIQILPECRVVDTTELTACPSPEAGDNCDVTSGRRVPDFVVVNLGSGFPLSVPFPFVNLGIINLKVSVRMPVTGG